MKMYLKKKITLLLALMLLVPFVWNMNITAVSAATPTFSKTKVGIVGTGETYQMVINNKVTGSTYKWSSSNTKVAKISGKGLITSQGKGSTTVKCKITYPTKKTKTLSCTVTVTVPATELRISNATEVNGAHLLTLGDQFDFNHEITPALSSDTTFWSIGGGDAACITINDSEKGIVTAAKAGKVILVVTAVKSSTKAAAEKSIINDAIIIEVTGPTATVKTAEIIGSNEIKVVFDSAVKQSTVIGANNTLSSNIELTLVKDIKGVLSQDPGKLTANLSTDGKTLTITSANTLSGEYGINFSSNIQTTGGIALETYYKKMSFIDTMYPFITTVTLDDSGKVATILFSEAMNFSNFKVTNASVVTPVGSSADTTTISTLNNTNNYIISTDKKSVTIDLSKIPTSDYNKLFSIIISGVTDLAGNSPANYTLTAYINIDTTPKGQAQLITVTRTGYNTLTAMFNRAIQDPGILQINGGTTITGIVDATDKKKVNYTMTDVEALYSGIKTVTVGYWNSFNVAPIDTSAQKMHTFHVDFTADRTSPVFTPEFDEVTGVLTLICNEEVTLTSVAGIFSATVNTISNDIIPGNNVTYTQITSTDKKVIKLKLANMIQKGNYTFEIGQGFMLDNFKNPNLRHVVSINNGSQTAAELPAPYLITQSTANFNEITLEFANKLDEASARTVSNYNITGVTIQSATLTKNTATGATVVLTLAPGSISASVAWPITITGVRGYNNSYQPITQYNSFVELKENTAPYYINNSLDVPTKTIKLNFNEAIKGNITVKVIQLNGNAPSIEIPVEVSISGSTANVLLSYLPPVGTNLRIDIVNNTLSDISGNLLNSNIPSTLGMVVYY